jgi:glycerol uptake facilitator-like aquaporin
VYWFAQYLGALAASGTVLGVYYGNFLLKYFEFIGWNPIFALSVLRVIL